MKNLTMKLLGMTVLATALTACGGDDDYDYGRYFANGGAAGCNYQPQGTPSGTVYKGNFGSQGDIQMLTYFVGNGEFEAVAVVNLSNALDAYFPGMGNNQNTGGGNFFGNFAASCPNGAVKVCVTTGGQIGHVDYDEKLDVSLSNGAYRADMGATANGVQARLEGTRIQGAVEITIPGCGTDTFIAN